MQNVLKILILEDSRDDVALIERELKRGGINFSSKVVNKKHEFEVALSEFRPDVILSDHSLPQFNSIEALALFKSYQPQLNLTSPFILITGAVSEEFAVQCIKAGADDYILKDRLKRLPAAIQSALEKSRMENERKKFLDEMIANETMMKEAEHLARFGSWRAEILTGRDKWSDEAYRIYGYAPGEIEAEYEAFLRHVHPEDLAEVKSGLDTAMAKLDSYENEFRIVDKNGKVKHLSTKIMIKRNAEGAPVVLTGFNLDITDKKNAEIELRNHLQAIEKQNENLMEIAWIQSHEVRAPLARIMGLINLLRDRRNNDMSPDELLNHIEFSANELDGIIRKIVRKTEAIKSSEQQQ